jgi:hypothetical protein
MDRKPMQPATNADTTQQRHQERAFGIALPVAVGKHFRCGDVVSSIVSERDFIPNEIIGSSDPIVFG